MSKFLRRSGKVVVVWAVVSLVVLDSAWACRRRGCSSHWQAPVCCEPFEVVCSEWSQDAFPAAPSPSDVDPPLSPVPSAAEPSPPAAASAPATIEPAPIEPAPALTVPANPVVSPPAAASAPTPAAAPASKPRSPSFTPDEDDPFAPAPSAAPKPPAARRATPAAPAPEDDDPFAPLPAKPHAPPAASPAKPAADPAADPFKILAQAQRPVRDWVDDTGLFRTRGQLVAILDGKVRILKETGRTTTVPLSRLSTADQQYVESQ